MFLELKARAVCHTIVKNLYSVYAIAACYIGSVLEWLGRSYENLEKCRQVKKK